LKNHALIHMLGCALPLFLILLLPAFGIKGDALFFIFIVLMFLCHLGMMGGHGHGHGGQEEKDEGHDHGAEGHEKHRGHYGCH
jgi:hypothetical protein